MAGVREPNSAGRTSSADKRERNVDPILECVPNVSEGRDRRVIESLAGAIRSVEEVRLADIHADLFSSPLWGEAR